MSPAISTAEAYGRCEAITRAEAANFYYGIRLLSGERRRAMCAAYAFARRIDDIGDGTLPDERKRELLDEAGAQLAELERTGTAAAAPDDAVIVALADAHGRFSLPDGALGELIVGVRMDVDAIAYESFDELVLYCRRVAGAIGRVCLAIFSTRERAGRTLERAQIEALADDLGVALQLTNILRDVREDALNGRVYLPREDLRRFEVGAGADMAQSAQALLAAAGREDAALIALTRFEAARAQQWFDRGMQLVPLLDRRSAACVAAMAGIYHRLLGRIEADPARALRERMSLSGGEKALVALRSLAGRTT
jgi:15-cis-phytoene synthase